MSKDFMKKELAQHCLRSIEIIKKDIKFELMSLKELEIRGHGSGFSFGG